MHVPATHDEIGAAIERLNSAVPKFGLTPQTLPQVVRVYREALEGYDRETVDGAAKMLIASCEKFPTPSLWRKACIEWLRHNRIRVEWKGEEDRDGNTVACRRCKSFGRYATMLRADGTEYQRMIALCNLDRHSPGDLIVPMPENFVRWAE